MISLSVTIQPQPLSISTQIAQAVVFGLSLGMLYALIALGLTLIFGLMDVINFAHGAFVTLGAYITFVTVATLGNFWIAIIIATILLGVVGVIIERGLVSRLYGMNPIYQLVLTFGVALVIEGLIIIRYGQTAKQVDIPAVFSGSPLTWGPFLVPRYRMFIIVFSAILIGLIWFVFQQTRLGLVIKAGIQDRERTQLLGIRLNRINMLIFGAGSALAGLAGAMMTPIFSAHPNLGVNFLIIAFVVIVVGGLGNLRGTIIAAIIIGILSQLVQTWYPEFAQPAIFVVMIVILLVRPEGIFGGAE